MSTIPHNEGPADPATRAAQAETRTEQANTRTEQAKTQVEQTSTRLAQAETQAEQAGVRTEQSKTQTDQTNTRVWQAEVQVAQSDIRTEQSKTQADQAFTRLAQAETQVAQDYTRTEQAETRTEQARTWTMEQALRASELSYRRLFEAAQDGILILDVDTGRVTDVNPFLTELLGYTRAEMLGKTVGELSPFKDVVSNQAMLERLQKDGYVRYEDLPLKTKDRRHVAVEFVSNVYQAGDIKVIQCNIRDITRRKQVESNLSLLAAIVESSDDAIIGKDLAGTVTSWNHGAEKIFGYSAGEMIGNSIQRLIPVDRQDEEAHILGKVKKCESVEHFETLRQTKAGRLIDVSVTASPIKNAAGQPIGVSKVLRDISERKKHAEQMLWKNTLLEAQLESSIDGILVVGNQGEQILQNRRMTELWKFPAQLVADKDEAAQLRYATSQTKNPEQFADRVNHLYAHPDETSRDEIELMDGTLLDRYSAPIRDTAGKNYGRIWSFRDITERRHLEQKFYQTQKLESIGQLAGGIAHDFNNILSCIVGYIHLAQHAAVDQPAILDYLHHISQASNRAVDLVKQILTFSRQNKPERALVELNQVVLEALKLLRASLPATIRIQTELTETPPVLADASAIHLIIMNLGTNAWHAMRPQPGTLKVEMGVMEVDDDFAKLHPDLHPGRYVRLTVSDTGCGMDQATLGKIFEPFFTTKAVGEGTGLGLAMVHGIMKSHDGGISVYSQPGTGTAFHLYFPVIEAAIPAPAIKSVTIARGQGERILFVDDEEVLAGLGKKVLERMGYQVTATSSVVEALAIVRAQAKPFDLVITDMSMPVMDGVKFGEQLLKFQPNLPIILTTGFSGFLTEEKVRELGFRELLNKPSTIQTLGEAVHRVLHPAASVG